MATQTLIKGIENNIYSRWKLIHNGLEGNKTHFELKSQICFPVRQFCPACKSYEIAPLNAVNGVGLAICHDCKLISTLYCPDNEYLTSYYTNLPKADRRSTDTKLLNQKRYSALLDFFEQFRGANKLLEIGCGFGDFLEAAEAKSWDTYGCELSIDKYKSCKRKGLRVSKDCITLSNYTENSFDVIILIEVIEHLQDIKAVLTKCYKLLRKGGVIYVTTPNYNSINRFLNSKTFSIVSFPEHLTYFSVNTLNNFMDSMGYKKLSCYAEGIAPIKLSFFNSKINNSNTVNAQSIRKVVYKNVFLRTSYKIINYLLKKFNYGVNIKGLFYK